jgi:hypothetical protein
MRGRCWALWLSLVHVGTGLPGGPRSTGYYLVISEHTKETLSQKEWEEKLLVVR